MKKQVSIYLLIFIACLSHLLIPDAVLGQVTQVFERYKDSFRRKDVHDHFPSVLRAFKTPRNQLILFPNAIKKFVDDPKFILRYYSDTDDSILILLTVNERFQELFKDSTFHVLLNNTAQIEDLARRIEGIPDAELISVDDCEIPEPEPEPRRATTLSIVSGYGQEDEPGSRLSSPFVVEVKDQYRDAFSGANVTFHVTQGRGRLSSTTVRPNSLGRAQTTLTLGSSAGVNVVRVTIAGISSSPQVFFTATAIEEPEPIVPEQPSTFPPVYWIEDNTIYYRPAGGEKEQLYVPTDGTLTGGLAVDMEGGRIYWTEEIGRGRERFKVLILTVAMFKLIRK